MVDFPQNTSDLGLQRRSLVFAYLDAWCGPSDEGQPRHFSAQLIYGTPATGHVISGETTAPFLRSLETGMLADFPWWTERKYR
jgi:hypothetical protein